MQSNKTAIVTGGSRGIGKAIAEELLNKGINVAVIGTRREEEVIKGFSIKSYSCSEYIYVQADISKSLDREKIIEKTIDRFGRIDILVNNAGVAPKERLDILETTEESYDFVMDINLKGTFFLTQKAANKMIENFKELNSLSDAPIIINISSLSAYTTSTNRAEYCISKAGISMVTSLFADKLSEHGIKVYEIRPGIIKTDMTSKVSEKYEKLISNGLTPIKRWGMPDDIAKCVYMLIDGALPFSTGEIINVDGGFHLRRL